MDDKLVKLQHFFSVDTRIKKEMYNMCPPTNQGYVDRDSLVSYTNDVNDSLIYIFSELKSIAVDLFPKEPEFLDKVKYLEKYIKKSFYKCGTDINKLRLFYRNLVSNMKPEFIDTVKDECVGYSRLEVDGSLAMAESINEILHLFHSYVLNNNMILSSVPVLAAKINDFGYPLNLRGLNASFFTQMFANFPNSIDVGYTDIVVLNERKAIMMVRDRGHALTIEVSLRNNICRMEYFIPKICNLEMVNNLPGINKINNDRIGATGVIEVPVEEFYDTLYDFISRVPMDSDMVYTSNSGLGR